MARSGGDSDSYEPDPIHSELPQPHVTSDLVPAIKVSDHGRGRDGRVNPHRRASKCFVSRILTSKFFEKRILRGISR